MTEGVLKICGTLPGFQRPRVSHEYMGQKNSSAGFPKESVFRQTFISILIGCLKIYIIMSSLAVKWMFKYCLLG